MKDYIKLWTEYYMSRSRYIIHDEAIIMGEECFHAGPKLSVAKIKIKVTPSKSFSIVSSVFPNSELRTLGFPENVIYGMLDVLLLSENSPIANIKINIIEAYPDDIHSSYMAFKKAGRDAANKIMRMAVSN